MTELDLKDWDLADLCHEIHLRSANAGWWDEMHDVVSTPQKYAIYSTKIALIHSEVSEMLEGLRKGLPDDHLPHRSMEEVEAADVFIRLADYCGARGLDLMGAVAEKLEYNAHRADHKRENRSKDGGKKF